MRFFQHPLRYFYRQRFGLSLPRPQAANDEEAFELAGLQQWKVANAVARQHLAGDPLERWHYSAQGLLPHGRAADAEWYRLMVDYRDLLERLTAYSGQPSELRAIDCQLAPDHRLSGEVRHFYPGLGLMHFSASKRLKGSDVMSLWLRHLALCADNWLPASESSRLFLPTRGSLSFKPLDREKARQLLLDYWQVFRDGQACPLPVFPETSFAWASADDPSRAFAAARQSWFGDSFRSVPGERDDRFIRLALHRNPDEPIEDEWFQHYARRIFAPAIIEAATHDS